MAKVAVFGSSGFVGRAVTDAAEASGHEVSSPRTPRLVVDLRSIDPEAGTVDGVEDATVDDVAAALSGHDAVVNAAGSASPRSAASGELFGPNAAWPWVLRQACARAGVARLVHVSSCAVQGRAAELDATCSYAPVSPYAVSKMLGEQLLLASRDEPPVGPADRPRRSREPNRNPPGRPGGFPLGPQLTPAADPVGDSRPQFPSKPPLAKPPLATTIYRPPSVHGRGRDMTRQFAAWCRRRPLLVAGDGGQPVPVALVDNVGAAVVALVAAAAAPPVVSHPYEGQTVRSLYELFAPGRPTYAIPPRAVAAAARVARPAERVAPGLAALSRRVELMLVGQRQAASWLDEQGYTLPHGQSAWEALARSYD